MTQVDRCRGAAFTGKAIPEPFATADRAQAEANLKTEMIARWRAQQGIALAWIGTFVEVKALKAVIGDLNGLNLLETAEDLGGIALALGLAYNAGGDAATGLINLALGAAGRDPIPPWRRNERATDWAREHAAELVRQVDDTTRQRLRDLVADAIDEGRGIPWIEEELVNTFDRWIIVKLGQAEPTPQTRAEMIARTETGYAFNAGTAQSYRENGITEVEISDNEGPNSCQACMEANGQVWTVTYFEMNLLEHPNCVRAALPVIG